MRRYSIQIFALLCALSISADGLSTSKSADDDKNKDDKKSDKRAILEVQAPTAYVTAAPHLAVSHGPTLLPAAPGIVYAPEKQIVAAASPSQLFAKPSPNLKISDVVLGQGQGYSGVINQLYPQQAYQPIGKLGYSVSAPIPAQLAYSKHQIFTPAQPVFQQHHHQPQPQILAQPAQLHYQTAQPIYQQHFNHHQHHQQQQPLFNAVQPQLLHVPQHYVQQPQLYHQQQPQPIFHQLQPQQQQLHYQHQQQPQFHRVVVPQPIVAQPQAYPGHLGGHQGAVSYASFSQGHAAGQQLQYPAKVQLIAQPAIARPIAHHQQPQPQIVYQHPPIVYHQHPQARALLHQPQVAYTPFQYRPQAPALAYQQGYVHH